MDLPLKMVIFHSYVSLPEGIQTVFLRITHESTMKFPIHALEVLEGTEDQAALHLPLPCVENLK